MIPQSILDFFHASKSLPFRSMTYFNFLLEATLAGSVLIIVMLILRRVFRRKIGSGLVYLAWGLVAVRLLLPFAIPNPLMDEFRPTYSTDAGARPVADQIRVRYNDAMDDVSYRLSAAAYDNDSQLAESLSTFTHEIAVYTSYGWLGKAYLLLYIAGGAAVLIIFGAQHLRFRRRLKKSAVGGLEGEQLASYQDLCRRLSIKPIPVQMIDPLPSPCLVGVVKPVIALPLTLPPEALAEALMHELSHLKARDNWWALVRSLCCAVHWFNPLVWLAQRLVRTDCELACDERVAAGLSEDERLHYANTLVLTAKRAYAPHAGVLATGMTMTGKRLKRRVNAIVHLRAVRRAAAIVTAVFLILLTVAAFSTAESVQQTTRLTTCQSAFPFAQNEDYPAPETVFGEKVALAPLRDVAEAEAQAKRYLSALYPEDRDGIETQYFYQVQQFNNQNWEIVAWPSRNSENHLYYMELTSTGRLVSVESNYFANGDGQRNQPSVLPGNLKAVLLDYGRQLSGAVLQDAPLDRAALREDMDTPEGRYVSYYLYIREAANDFVSLTVQIAPTFHLEGVYYMVNNGAGSETDNIPAEVVTETLTYSKNTDISFAAKAWGRTDSQYVILADAVLTRQEAFDRAMDTLLERTDLTTEALLALTLSYGYYDKANFDGNASVWRFSWQVSDEEADRYWVSISDTQELIVEDFSTPGEGLG